MVTINVNLGPKRRRRRRRNPKGRRNARILTHFLLGKTAEGLGFKGKPKPAAQPTKNDRKRSGATRAATEAAAKAAAKKFVTKRTAHARTAASGV